MAHRHKVHSGKHKNVGGAVAYAGGSSKVAKEAKSKEDGFKHGGKVHGHKGHHRLDKRARGGRTGGSPFSSAHMGHKEEGNHTYKHGGRAKHHPM